jgi:hypothetical protein
MENLLIGVNVANAKAALATRAQIRLHEKPKLFANNEGRTTSKGYLTEALPFKRGPLPVKQRNLSKSSY